MVMAAIDGTLIPIGAPAKEEYLYVCHNGFHGIDQRDGSLGCRNAIYKTCAQVACFDQSMTQLSSTGAHCRFT